MSICENIRTCRKERHLTQEELAETMGVSCAAVSKWENGQCAPDLGTLASLADFFEISVDALLDHRVNADRQATLLKEAAAAADSHEVEKAAALCEELLRKYPNEPEVAEHCAGIYYQLYVFTMKEVYMEACIAQTKRLFTLNKGESEAKRLSRLRQLANQHELLGQWDKARALFEQSNLEKENNGGIARCLLNQGRTQEALTLASEAVMDETFRLSQTVHTLALIWEALGDTDKACRCLEWIEGPMEALQYNPRVLRLDLSIIANWHLRNGNIEAVRTAVRKAEMYRQMPEDRDTVDFIRLEKPIKHLISENTEEIFDYLENAVKGSR